MPGPFYNAAVIADRIEGKWIELFAGVFARCKVAAGDVCAVLSETQSRALNVHLAELALHRLGAKPFHVVVPTPRQSAPVPIRSTGASTALQGIAPAVAALSSSVFVADCTVEGLMHAAELPQILKAGARVLYISNEHPDVLERLAPCPADEQQVREGMRRLKQAKRMEVSSAAGTRLQIRIEGARVGGVWGYTEKPGTLSHWPGGLCLAFPGPASVEGMLVMAPGDLNLTFKRYVESEVDFERCFASERELTFIVANLSQGCEELRGNRTERDVERFRLVARAGYTIPVLHPLVEIDGDLYGDA